MENYNWQLDSKNHTLKGRLIVKKEIRKCVFCGEAIETNPNNATQAVNDTEFYSEPCQLYGLLIAVLVVAAGIILVYMGR